MSTTYKFLYPPVLIGSGVTMNFKKRRNDSEGYYALMYLPDNKYHPFAVVKWYPWNGSAEWASGSYYDDAIMAVAAFNKANA